MDANTQGQDDAPIGTEGLAPSGSEEREHIEVVNGGTGQERPPGTQRGERSRSPPLPPRIGTRLRNHMVADEGWIGSRRPTLLHQLAAERYGQEGIEGVLALNIATVDGNPFARVERTG